MSSVPSNIITKPAYLQNVEVEDQSDLRKILSPPRLKVIQKTTGIKFKPQFKDGDIIILPDMVKIGDQETEFTFVPLHFFQSFACFNPWKMKDTLPYVREQTLDENSVIAKKAKAFISEDCPENKKEKIEYRSVLNFMIRVVAPTDIKLPELPLTLLCNKGEFQQGRILSELITARNAPRYVQQYNGIAKYRSGKGDGDWFGIDFRNAPEPWVAEALVSRMREEHLLMKKIVDERMIQINMDDTNVEEQDYAANNKM